MSTTPTTPALAAEYARIVDDLTYHYDGVFSRQTVRDGSTGEQIPAVDEDRR